MMNEIVTWAKQWPEAEVKTITLNADDAWPGNRQRRNRLYEQFNIAFDYDQHSDHGSGRSRSMHAGALTPVDTWTRNIVERPERLIRGVMATYFKPLAATSSSGAGGALTRRPTLPRLR